jgi:hypothetical protein
MCIWEALHSWYSPSGNWQYDPGGARAKPTRFWGKEVGRFPSRHRAFPCASSSQPPFCCRLGALGARLWSCSLIVGEGIREAGEVFLSKRTGTAALPIAARRRAVISRPPIVRNSRVNEARPKGDRGAPFSWIPSLQLSERRRKIVL